jgi:pyrroline-5-carboxylate reductase
MVTETVAGTGALLGRREAEDVRKGVASPGGSTEKGLEALAENGFEDALRAAVDASLAKMGR